MKRHLANFLLISSIFSQDSKLAVSILDFTGEDVKPKVLKACFQRLETSLIESDQFIVIEKSEREEILKEQEIQSSGVCDEECVVEIGQLLGAEYLILGDIIEFPGLYQIDLKIVNIEKGDITEKVTEEIEGGIKDLLDGMEQTSNEIIRRISVFNPNVAQYYNNTSEIIEKEKFGKITIYSDPSGAIILIDNEKMGSTPIENKRIKVGTRNLKIIKNGYITINKGVKISENSSSTVDEVLIIKTGGINVSSTPRGSKIYLDNKYIGLSPIKIPDIIIGQHEIKASHEDYLTGIESILIEYDIFKDLKVNLSPKPGTVNIVPSVSDAKIYIDNKYYKSDPSGFTTIKLVPGEYVIELRKIGYISVEIKVKIFANQSETIEVELYLQDKVEIKTATNSNPYAHLDPTWENTKAKIANRYYKSAWTHKLNGKISNNYILIDMDEAIIRSEPFQHSSRLGFVYKGTRLTITDKSGDYVKVEAPVYGFDDSKDNGKVSTINKSNSNNTVSYQDRKKEGTYKQRHPLSAALTDAFFPSLLNDDADDIGYQCGSCIWWLLILYYWAENPEIFE